MFILIAIGPQLDESVEIVVGSARDIEIVGLEKERIFLNPDEDFWRGLAQFFNKSSFEIPRPRGKVPFGVEDHRMDLSRHGKGAVGKKGFREGNQEVVKRGLSLEELGREFPDQTADDFGAIGRRDKEILLLVG